MCCLIDDELHENGETKNLPHGAGRLHIGEEVKDNGVPQELADEADDKNTDNKGEERAH